MTRHVGAVTAKVGENLFGPYTGYNVRCIIMAVGQAAFHKETVNTPYRYDHFVAIRY